MGQLPDDHDCPWRARVDELEAKLAALTAAMEALERRVLGPKAEKMPPVSEELRAERTAEELEEARAAGLALRRAREALRQRLRIETVIHHVPAEDRRCPRCGGDEFRPLGDGRKTTIFEYVPGYFVRQEHVQEKLSCRCGQHIVQADPPLKPFEKSRYGP